MTKISNFFLHFSEAQVLTDEQSKWIEKTEKVIHELINETPPDGSKFSLAVKHILHREEQWNIWKNQGCQPLTPKVDPKEAKPVTTPSKSSISKFCENLIFFPGNYNEFSFRNGNDEKEESQVG